MTLTKDAGAWLSNYRDCPFPTMEPPKYGVRILVGVDEAIAFVVEADEMPFPGITGQRLIKDLQWIVDQLKAQVPYKSMAPLEPRDAK